MQGKGEQDGGRKREEREGEECRTPPVRQRDLISNVSGSAEMENASLRNPWGLVSDGCGKTLMIANNGSGTVSVTSFRGSLPFTFTVPGVSGTGQPTGLVINETNDYVITKDGVTVPSHLIIVSRDGVISGFNLALDQTSAITAVSTGNVLTGVAMRGTILYVANFSLGSVDVYSGTFALTTRLTDPGLTAISYAPFNVATINERLYVAFALRTIFNLTSPGPGHGYIDVLRGGALTRFIERGPLNAPWGLTGTPNTLFVGNHGDGLIHSFDPNSGHLRGPLRDRCHNVIQIEGLWGLAMGREARMKEVRCEDDDWDERRDRKRGKKHGKKGKRGKREKHRKRRTALFLAAGIDNLVNGLVSELVFLRPRAEQREE